MEQPDRKSRSRTRLVLRECTSSKPRRTVRHRIEGSEQTRTASSAQRDPSGHFKGQIRDRSTSVSADVVGHQTLTSDPQVSIQQAEEHVVVQPISSGNDSPVTRYAQEKGDDVGAILMYALL